MPQSNACPSVRDSLRAKTAAAHTRLHTHPFFAALLHGSLTRETYTAMLSRLLGFHGPLEKELFSAARRLGLESIMQGRRRVPDLELDLQDLGVSQSQLDAFPQARFQPIVTKDKFFGTLYVREGSTLGGTVLARSLDRLLPNHRGRRFLSGHQQDSKLWRKFLEELELAGTTGILPVLLEGAEETFAAMEAWLNGACSA
ncbi:MAG: biliverdin-producing heme oxygenase [Bryobacterales bacterium]